MALSKSQREDSNPRPADYKSAALPTELRWHNIPSVRSLISTYIWEKMSKRKIYSQGILFSLVNLPQLPYLPILQKIIKNIILL